MADSKQEAQDALDNAQEKYDSALEELRAARAELDEYLREEQVPVLAQYMGLDPDDEDDLELARSVQQRRRSDDVETRLAAQREIEDHVISSGGEVGGGI